MNWKKTLETAKSIPNMLANAKTAIQYVQAGLDVVNYGIDRFNKVGNTDEKETTEKDAGN